MNDWLDNMVACMKYWIHKMEEAKTTEDIMRYKKGMLVNYVTNMPTGSNECYFCLLYQMDDCEEVCEYGMVHGFCNNEGSDYGEIRKLERELKRKIEERYYRGESYDLSEIP